MDQTRLGIRCPPWEPRARAQVWTEDPEGATRDPRAGEKGYLCTALWEESWEVGPWKLASENEEEPARGRGSLVEGTAGVKGWGDRWGPEVRGEGVERQMEARGAAMRSGAGVCFKFRG